jgi:Holliday junction DNA helicase RuvA
MPTYLAVREDALTLYGFVEDDERTLFETLLTVTGVGPKVAQNLVAALPPQRLVEAVGRGDEAQLTAVPGVGKKLAQRLILELADKIGQRSWTMSAPADAPLNDVLEALAGLGFTAVEARRAARAARQRLGEGAALEELIRYALRQLGTGG